MEPRQHLSVPHTSQAYICLSQGLLPALPAEVGVSPLVPWLAQTFTPSDLPLLLLLGGTRITFLNLWLCLFHVFPTGTFTGKSAQHSC